jgi:hypothetical protein
MIMNIRIIAASVLALSLLAPAAYAGNFGNPNAPAGSEVTNKVADYAIGADVGSSTVGSTEALSVATDYNGKGHFNTGDYIDETNVERNQRSSR